MKFKDYRKQVLEALGGIYSPEEASAVFDILMDAQGLPSYYYIIEGEQPVSEEMQRWFSTAVERLCKGEPVAHIVGYKVFYGRRFKVSPDVLIPRWETEEMCLEAIKHCKSLQDKAEGWLGKAQEAGAQGGDDGAQGVRPRVLDLCTGSGCIAWTLSLETGAEVVAVDISEKALDVAKAQGKFISSENGGSMTGDAERASETGDRVIVKPKFIKADVLDTESVIPMLQAAVEGGKYDIILSNPPYVLESEKQDMDSIVKDHDPALALFVPDDDVQKFNTAIGLIASALLVEGGLLMVEINEKLGKESLEALVKAYEGGLKNAFDNGKDRTADAISLKTGIKKDLAGRDRFVFIGGNVS
ncbi:MAG: peptide chain release factor N(5)-glutamine methyltransferase [Bacteroidales bacterium]|nr:peptide chain release factor N(5)-glutamine methyltransferase [Bacteroidales bacterium]